MKRSLIYLFSALCATCLLCHPVDASPSVETAKTSTPGADLSAAVSQITGIAISPLLGMGTIGAVKYFRADARNRPSLPWFAQPWFWGPALFLALLCFAKDAGGPVIPTVLKKPLDLAEVFENKISGLIATGAIVPLALTIFHSMDSTSGLLSGAGFAAIDVSPLLNAMMVPVALAIYGVVWLVSHTVHILILISPFGIVDTALKSFRTGVLASVVASHWLSDTLGLVWAGCIIIVCALLSGWAFRLLIFGNAFAWDLISFRRRRFKPDLDGNTAFLARSFQGAPVRTLGKLEKSGAAKLMFRYRPWLILPERTVELPDGRYAFGRGVIYPALIHLSPDGERDLASFPPRCRGHENQLAAIYDAAEIRDTGIRAAWGWLKSCFGGKPALK
jgi:hypothetical protein